MIELSANIDLIAARKREQLMRFNEVKKVYDLSSERLKLLKEQKQNQEKNISSMRKIQEIVRLKKVILSEASETARDDARHELERLATFALQAIIGKHVSLKVEILDKGNSPVAEFRVVTRYGDEEGDFIEADPAEEEGGGIADIVSFSTLITMLQLVGSPNNKAPLFFDEPSKFVSKGHSKDVARFLSQISDIFDRQVFMVTHDQNLAEAGDKAYHFQVENGTTQATVVDRDQFKEETEEASS